MINKALLAACIGLLFCCRRPREKPCLIDLTFEPKYESLEPSQIHLKLRDADRTLENAAREYKVKAIVFYAFDKKDRAQGYMRPGYFKKTADTISLFVGIGHFKPGQDGVVKWKKEAVERFLLNERIGIVIGNDTVLTDVCFQ